MFIKLQRGQFKKVENIWDLSIVNGQHGEGIYAFKYGNKSMINYYTKNDETLYTFITIHNIKHLCLNTMDMVFLQVKEIFIFNIFYVTLYNILRIL